MKPYQTPGYVMANTSAITAIVGSRITFALRPPGASLPAINYFTASGYALRYGMETQPFTVNCRAQTAAAAEDLAREVRDLFNGSAATATYGTRNGFDITRAFAEPGPGTIYEEADAVYNCPATVTIVYPSSTVG